MVYITLPEARQRRLVFYLSMEEYIADHIDDITPDSDGHREAFFIWQVDPTVIFGRNQVFEAEVNIDYCREHGIQLYRRKSGGGCVYSDRGNIMLSFISDNTDVASCFEQYLDKLTGCLYACGVNAERSGRNDVLVDGLKVSGNAFFHRTGASIVHGTLLFNSDFEEMERAISPSKMKLASKGVSSVRQRVMNLRDALSRSKEACAAGLEDIETFKRQLVGSICRGGAEMTLSPEQTAQIEELEKGYLDPDFLYGRHHAWAESRRARIDGAGEIEMRIQMDGELISGCCVSGDFFTLKDGLNEYLSAVLKGRRMTDGDAGAALEASSPEEYVTRLTGCALRELFFGNKIKNPYLGNQL